MKVNQLQPLHTDGLILLKSGNGGYPRKSSVISGQSPLKEGSFPLLRAV